MLEFFQNKRFRADTLATIEKANEIIEEYDQQGYSLTLRQLYYQLVARDFFGNTERNYRNLSRILSDARLAGLVSWTAIEDRTRNLTKWKHQSSPKGALQTTLDKYYLDMWLDQPYYVEVWVEKEALVGVVDRVCSKYDLPYFACRGYVSQSEQYRAGKRLAEKDYNGQQPLVLHLGDHDPSGIDMTRDNKDRLEMFAEYQIEVRRLALNMDQIEELKPPPNPAKLTDSHCGDYIRRFGRSSWELDALSPSFINNLIEEQLQNIIDWDIWEKRQQQQETDREVLKSFINELED